MDDILHTPLTPEKQPGYGPRENDEPSLKGEDEPFYDRVSSEPEVHAEARTQGLDPDISTPTRQDRVDHADEPLPAADQPADPLEAFENVNEETTILPAGGQPLPADRSTN